MERPGFVEGRHYTEWVPEVRALKRAGDTVRAEQLLLKLVQATEDEARADGTSPAPGYYEELAKIYRARRAYQDEVAVLERLSHHPAFAGEPSPFSARLRKARHLRDGGSNQLPKRQRDREAALQRAESIGSTEADFDAEEQRLRDGLGVALPGDVFWSLANRAVIEQSATQDWYRLSITRRGMAEFLHHEGKRSWAEQLRLAWDATARWLLTFEPPDTSYRLAACVCAVCQRDDGLRRPLLQTVGYSGIPHADCEKGYCKCSWQTAWA